MCEHTIFCVCHTFEATMVFHFEIKGGDIRKLQVYVANMFDNWFCVIDCEVIQKKMFKR